MNVQKPVTGCNAIEYNTLQVLKLRCVNRCLDRYANRCPKKGLPKDATTPLILKDLTDQKSYPERSRFLDARRYDRILHVHVINQIMWYRSDERAWWRLSIALLYNMIRVKSERRETDCLWWIGLLVLQHVLSSALWQIIKVRSYRETYISIMNLSFSPMVL